MIQEIAVLTPLYVTIFWALVFLGASIRKNKARFFLGFFMVAAFILYLGHSLFFLSRFDIYFYYDHLYIASSLLVYPMYYQYIRLLTIDQHVKGSYFFHYIPSLALLLAGFLLQHTLYKKVDTDLELYFREVFSFPKNFRSEFFQVQVYHLLHRIIFAVQVICYLILGYRLIIKHRERILNYYSNQENRNIKWVSYIFISLVLTALLSTVFNIIGRFTFLHEENSLLVPSLLFSSMIFILGYLANGQNQIVRDINLADKREVELIEDALIPEPEDIRLRLESLFTAEKIYLNPDLKIWDLTALIGTNRTYLSSYINKTYGQNFSMYVNRFRVDEAKAMLKNAEWDKYSLDIIGEKCGFGSYNNFIRVFREYENITPGKYREKAKRDHMK